MLESADSTGHYYCPRCGYDLRGQTVNRCPECGFEYDKAALDSISREAFHGCIGPYLSAVPMLVWSPAFSILSLCGRPGMVLSCGGVFLLPFLLFVPQTVVNWLESWIMRALVDRPRWSRGSSIAWPWNAEDLAAASPFLMALMVNGVIALAVWPPLAVIVSGGVLGVGLWRTGAGASFQYGLESASQHLLMPPRRVEALRRARSACRWLAGIDALLWLILIAV